MEKQTSFTDQRTQMVMQQLVARGIRDTAVLAAMNQVPRERFVPQSYRAHAYEDCPLPIPANQTISQPYIVALMLSKLRLEPTNRILEIGTGSGYAAAILGQIVRQVFTVERHAELVLYARKRLQTLQYTNIQVHQGDGTLGWPEFAPYNGIVVSAGGPEVPRSLKPQLTIGGRLVIPVGRHHRQQQLIILTRYSETIFDEERCMPVSFVPLIGAEGWRGEDDWDEMRH